MSVASLNSMLRAYLKNPTVGICVAVIQHSGYAEGEFKVLLDYLRTP